jgi:purine-binding chemotaxis protein CheW
VLEERARALARVPARPPSASEVLDVVTFSQADQDYAIELRHVRKIVPLIEMTPVPGAPDVFAGVINLRGEILAVVDLGRLHGAAGGRRTGHTHVLVLGGERNEFGLLADAVGEVMALRVDDVLELPGDAGLDRPCLRGLTESRLIVLDGDALLRDDRLFIDQGDGAGA